MAAALEQILLQTRRIPRSLLLRHCRPFSTSDPNPNPNPNPTPQQQQQPPNNNNPIREPVNIQPVSYAVKPKPEQQQQPISQDGSPPMAFTREEVRYMKDTPLAAASASVSNPNKVAPLPDDITRVAAEEGRGEVEREGRMIDEDRRAFRRVFKAVEEEVEVPFPTLIQVEKKQNERLVVDLQDAIRQVKANAKRNFDETVEAHVNLGIDRRRSDLGVSGAVVLPHGTGKSVKVAVFAEGADAEEARKAGADIVGGDELIEQIRTSGKINFDKCIATHSMMQRVTKIGKILRGLTPNAKRGTVTNNVAAAVKESKQGLLDFRMKDAIVHVGLGKVSFPEESLHENVGAFVNALLLAKPAGLKKTSKYAGYVNSFHLCSTMGPGYSVSIQSLSRAADMYTKLRPQ